MASRPTIPIALAETTVNFERSLILARQQPADEGTLSSLAEAALAEAQEDKALPLLRSAAERGRSALLWQWTALLQRSLDDQEHSIDSFRRAAALAPTDASIAHGHARVALEAGLPAEELFEACLRLSPGNLDVIQGYAASLLAAGKRDAAEGTLAHVLERAPLWTEGHVALAQLRSIIGKKERSTTSVEQAIERWPHHKELWLTLFRLLLQAERFSELDEQVGRAKTHLGNDADVVRFEAITAGERGDVARADRLFGAMASSQRQAAVVFFIRHLLRAGRVQQACQSIEGALATDQAPYVWPYAAIAWRLSGDQRSNWLEGDLDRTVCVIDLTGDLPDLGSLDGVLRKLHAGKGEFLDQSVRGGSQTDGPLFTRLEPEIRSLRKAIVAAVEAYVQNLPAFDSTHPLLGRPRNRRIRFSGSWSVLLRSQGFHASHVHPEGWISSALYIHLPERSPTEPKTAGWLSIGQPEPRLGVQLDPLREIEPKVGQLVLFPSYMWHGTRPFAAGERLTVAFDVRPPV